MKSTTKSLAKKTLGLMILISLTSASGALAESGGHAETGHKENTKESKSRNLFPKPEADKSKTARMPKVTLLEPKALSTVQGAQVTLKWQEAAGADSYRVQVATDPNFKWLVANEDFYQGTSYEVKGLEAGKHYFWRVYAWKSDNDPSYMSGFADFSSFETK